MTRIMQAALAVLILFAATINSAFSVGQPQANLSGTHAVTLGYVEDATNATVTLVPAVTGQSVTLYKMTLSTSAADQVYLTCGATQKTGKVYLGANSGLDSTYFPLYIRCAAGEALSLVKGTATTPISATLWYTQD